MINEESILDVVARQRQTSMLGLSNGSPWIKKGIKLPTQSILRGRSVCASRGRAVRPAGDGFTRILPSHWPIAFEFTKLYKS